MPICFNRPDSSRFPRRIRASPGRVCVCNVASPFSNRQGAIYGGRIEWAHYCGALATDGVEALVRKCGDAAYENKECDKSYRSAKIPQAALPTVSAITAPRAPSSLSRPTVESRAV